MWLRRRQNNDHHTQHTLTTNHCCAYYRNLIVVAEFVDWNRNFRTFFLFRSFCEAFLLAKKNIVFSPRQASAVYRIDVLDLIEGNVCRSRQLSISRFRSDWNSITKYVISLPTLDATNEWKSNQIERWTCNQIVFVDSESCACHSAMRKRQRTIKNENATFSVGSPGHT